MGELTFRVPLNNSNALRIIAKLRILFLLVILISTIAILIPDTSFAKSLNDTELIAREQAQIEKFKEKVKRKGDTLLLKSKSGTYISLKDSPGCESYSTCFSYAFADYYKEIGFYLVKVILLEGPGVMMVSEIDGKEYYVDVPPILSPDNKHIISIPQDVETGYGENGVYIWRIKEGKLIQEFSKVPTEYAIYEFVRWKDNKSIELKKWLHSSKELCPEDNYMKIPISLEMEDDGWKLYRDLSPDSVECFDKW